MIERSMRKRTEQVGGPKAGTAPVADCVPPEEAPTARPWPWRGKRTPPMTTYTPGQRALMTFFYIVSVLMVVGIIVVSVLTFVPGLRPGLTP